MNDCIETKAMIFAAKAHDGQKRKYTGEPYIWHPIEVARLLRDNDYGGNVIAAALLHDVVEDTDVTIEQIKSEFGRAVAELVSQVTDVSKPSDGNRRVRKAIDAQHLANASQLAQTIKLADLISNTRSIVQYDPDFAKIYLREKRELLDVMTGGDTTLRWVAVELIGDFQ